MQVLVPVSRVWPSGQEVQTFYDEHVEQEGEQNSQVLLILENIPSAHCVQVVVVPSKEQVVQPGKTQSHYWQVLSEDKYMFKEASQIQDVPTRIKVLRQVVHTPDPEQVAQPLGQALQESPLELT